MLTLDETLEVLVDLALNEDLGDSGDVTSQVTVPANRRLEGLVTAKAAGVIAGTMAFESVYRRVDPSLSIEVFVQDGAVVQRGTSVCGVTGNARSILTGERVALNFMQRLSGIATLTARFVEAVEGTGAIILDTRKTAPGWRMLDKYAVRAGGGQNHRVGLYDMVMIKDNHIAAAGGIQTAVSRVRADARAAALPLVVEVENLEQLREVLVFQPDRILLDNMNPETLRAAVALAAGRCPLEASGNVTLDNVRAVAETGVNYISVGALTHSAPAFDLSMRLTYA